MVQDYLRAATSENTRRAYRSDLRHFVDWGGSIPSDDVVVAEYLAAYAGGLAVSTMTRRLAAISKAHTAQGLSTPTVSDLVCTTMRGIRRAHGRPQRQVTGVPVFLSDVFQGTALMTMLVALLFTNYRLRMSWSGHG